MRIASDKHSKNITNRGSVKQSLVRDMFSIIIKFYSIDALNIMFKILFVLNLVGK